MEAAGNKEIWKKHIPHSYSTLTEREQIEPTNIKYIRIYVMKGAGWKLSALKTGLTPVTEVGSATDDVKIRVEQSSVVFHFHCTKVNHSIV